MGHDLDNIDRWQIDVKHAETGVWEPRNRFARMSQANTAYDAMTLVRGSGKRLSHIHADGSRQVIRQDLNTARYYERERRQDIEFFLRSAYEGRHHEAYTGDPACPLGEWISMGSALLNIRPDGRTSLYIADCPDDAREVMAELEREFRVWDAA
jgi:hypothetical protein